MAIGTDPNDPDSDDDGLLDGEEVNDMGTNEQSIIFHVIEYSADLVNKADSALLHAQALVLR